MIGDDPRTVPAPRCRLGVRSTPAGDVYVGEGTAKQIAGARLFWLGGPLAETATRAGVHAVTMHALVRSPSPTAPLAEMLESMGVTVTAGVSAACCYIDLRGPRDHLSEALRHTAHALARVRVDEAAFQVDAAAFQAARSTTIHQVEQRAQDRRQVAADSFRAAWAGAQSGFARPPEGTYVSLHALRPRDVQTVAQEISRRRLSLLIAGDPEAECYVDAIGELASDSTNGSEPELPALQALVPLPARLQVDVGGGGPAYLLWGAITSAGSAADHVVVETAAHILGGWSGSRWQSLLRDQLGYTYGTTAATSSLRLGGQVYTSVQVGMSIPAGAVDEVQDLVAEQAEDLISRAADAQLHRAACVRLLRSEAHFHDSTRNLMARTASFLQAGLGPEFAEQRMTALRENTPERFAERLRPLLAHTMVLTVRPSAR
jgi:zinc protease